MKKQIVNWRSVWKEFEVWLNKRGRTIPPDERRFLRKLVENDLKGGK